MPLDIPLVTDEDNAPSDFERANMLTVLNDPKRYDNFSARSSEPQPRPTRTTGSA